MACALFLCTTSPVRGISFITDEVAVCYSYANEANEPVIERPDSLYVCSKDSVGKVLSGGFEKKTVCRPPTDGVASCPDDMTLGINTYEPVVFPVCECSGFERIPSEVLSRLGERTQLCVKDQNKKCYPRSNVYLDAVNQTSLTGQGQFAFGSFFGCPDDMTPCISSQGCGAGKDILLLRQVEAADSFVVTVELDRLVPNGNPLCDVNTVYGSSYCYLSVGDNFKIQGTVTILKDIPISDLAVKISVSATLANSTTFEADALECSIFDPTCRLSIPELGINQPISLIDPGLITQNQGFNQLSSAVVIPGSRNTSKFTFEEDVDVTNFLGGLQAPLDALNLFLKSASITISIVNGAGTELIKITVAAILCGLDINSLTPAPTLTPLR